MFTKKTFRKIGFIIITVGSMGLIAAGCVCLIIHCAPLFCDKTQQDAFVTASSTVLGGLCTIIGVAITIFFNTRSNNAAYKEACRPEIFVPDIYDIADAVKISLMCSTSVLANNHPQIVSWAKPVYLKNSDKASFDILLVKTNVGNFEPKTVQHIEKGNLFCLRFYGTQFISQLSIEVRSADSNKYTFNVSFLNERPFIVEAVDKNACR